MIQRIKSSIDLVEDNDGSSNSILLDLGTVSIHQRQFDGPADVLKAEIIANHTAMQPCAALRTSFLMQSFRTAAPLFVVDVLVGVACLLFSCYVVNWTQGKEFNTGVWHQLPAFLVLQLFMFSLLQVYPGAGLSAVSEIRGICKATLYNVVCLSSLNLIVGRHPRIEYMVFAFAALCVMIVLPLARRLVRRWLCKTDWWGVKILIVGRRKNCREAIRQLNRRRPLGYVPVGYTSSSAKPSSHMNTDCLGNNRDATDIAKSWNAPVVGLASSRDHIENFERLVFTFSGVVWMNHTNIKSPAIDTNGLPEVITHGRSMPFLKFIPRLTKRFIDLAICIPLLMLLFIPMMIIGIAIRIISPGPIFYSSLRIGQHGRPFKMWKFRSMVPNADGVLVNKLAADSVATAEWAADQKLKDDPRIIPIVGAVMRRCSLDELPQLWNVFCGEMSLVGPRPVPENEIMRYGRTYYEYTQMWPGITGLWQVSGRNDTSYETRLYLVHQYAINWSPWLDAWILLKTPSAVLTKRGAY